MESEHEKQENAEPQARNPSTEAAPASAGEPTAEADAAAASEPAADAPKTDALPPAASSRRVFIGLGVGAVVIIGAALAIQHTPRTPEGPGDVVAAEITLITSDRTDVECAAANGIGEYRCGYSDENTPAKGEEKNTLRPYYTVDRHLYLVPGLFLNPAVQERFKSELPDKPRDLLKRFSARCNLKLLGKVAGVRVRWIANSPWNPADEVDAATVVDCKVDG